MTRAIFTVRPSQLGPQPALWHPDCAPFPAAGEPAELLRYAVPDWDGRTLDELMAAYHTGDLKTARDHQKAAAPPDPFSNLGFTSNRAALKTAEARYRRAAAALNREDPTGIATKDRLQDLNAGIERLRRELAI